MRSFIAHERGTPQVYPIPMQVILDIPDTLAAHLTSTGKDPARAALEALLVDAYRARKVNEGEMKRVLGFGTRMQVHALLREHDVPLNYTEEHLRLDIAGCPTSHS